MLTLDIQVELSTAFLLLDPCLFYLRLLVFNELKLPQKWSCSYPIDHKSSNLQNIEDKAWPIAEHPLRSRNNACRCPSIISMKSTDADRNPQSELNSP
jgi:hypothetical protein